MITIKLFSGFEEEGKTSMYYYSRQLEHSLKSNEQVHYNVENYFPKYKWLFLARIVGELNLFRINKYVVNPINVRMLKRDVNHIIDHTNAHLIFSLGRKRSVITVHDIIPLKRSKGLISGLSPVRYPLLFKLSLTFMNKASKIVAVSQSTKNDLVEHCFIDSSRIEVIYNPINPEFRRLENFDLALEKEKLGIKNSKSFIILLVGSLEYKNHNNALLAISDLELTHGYDIQVIILKASSFDLYINTLDYQLSKRVIVLSNLSLNEVCMLYNVSDCLLFPSFYEGFGWPPLEAVSCGTPVIVSDIPVLRETLSEIGIFINPNDVSSITRGLKHVIDNIDSVLFDIENYSEKLKLKFSKEKFLSKYLSLYNEVLGE